MRNVRLTVGPMVIGILDSLEKKGWRNEISGRTEIIQKAVLLKSSRILRRVPVFKIFNVKFIFKLTILTITLRIIG